MEAKAKAQFTITNQQKLFVERFRIFEDRVVIGETLKIDVTNKLDKLFRMVSDIVKAEESVEVPEFSTFRYHVNFYEILTDNREVFGHANITSEKLISTTGSTYIKGEWGYLDTLLTKQAEGKISVPLNNALKNFIATNLGTTKSKITKKQLKQRLIWVQTVSLGRIEIYPFERDERLMLV